MSYLGSLAYSIPQIKSWSKRGSMTVVWRIFLMMTVLPFPRNLHLMMKMLSQFLCGCLMEVGVVADFQDRQVTAKVSDFGLVKLASDGANSVITRLAGTFGYLAREYAVTDKITTNALTGLMALDEERPEESQYLA